MDDTRERLWDGQSRGGSWGYLFFIYAIRIFGIKSAYCFLSLIIPYFILFVPKASSAIWHYNKKIRKLGVLQSLLGIYAHYYVFGQILIDKLAMRSGLFHKYKYVYEHYDRFMQIINGADGMIIIGAHVGNWEAGNSFWGKYGKKMNIVMLDAELEQIKNVLKKNNQRADNYKIINVGEDTLQALLDIKSALNKSEYVCFNGDRYVDVKSTKRFKFLGKDALFPIGPFSIADKSNVPVVFYFAMREPEMTYRFIFYEADRSDPSSTDNLLKQYIEVLEEVVKSYPKQWFNFYKYWN